MATIKEQQNFVKVVYPAAKALWENKPAEAIHPLFVTAQAACETGFNLGSIPNNIFGITKGSSWKGAVKLVLTTEYFQIPNKAFASPERVVSVEKINDKRYRYKCYRFFRVYDRLEDCLEDHLKILQSSGYKDAYPYRHDPKEYARRISDSTGAKYATAPDYAKIIGNFIDAVEKRLKELEKAGI